MGVHSLCSRFQQFIATLRQIQVTKVKSMKRNPTDTALNLHWLAAFVNSFHARLNYVRLEIYIASGTAD